MPRLATSQDLEAVLRLAAEAPGRTWRSQRPEETTLPSLDDPDFDLFVTDDVAGFLVLKKRLVRGLTGDRESVIRDSFARDVREHRRLIEHAAEVARGYDSQFLTAEVAPDDPRRRLLEAMGFHLESHKISVPTAECRIPEDSPYAVRPAEPEDAFLIAVLNSTMLPHTLSAGREYNLSELTFRSMGDMMAQVNRQDPKSAALVLTLDGQMVGHLLLEIDERIGYIYDLALAREHWGGTAVRHLMRAGSTLLHHRNIPLFVGDVSAANRRALVVAQRALGFSVDCQRYGLTLR